MADRLKLRQGGAITRRWSESVSRGERLGLRYFQQGGHSPVAASHLTAVEPRSQRLLVKVSGRDKHGVLREMVVDELEAHRWL